MGAARSLCEPPGIKSPEIESVQKGEPAYDIIEKRLFIVCENELELYKLAERVLASRDVLLAECRELEASRSCFVLRPREAFAFCQKVMDVLVQVYFCLGPHILAEVGLADRLSL